MLSAWASGVTLTSPRYFLRVVGHGAVLGPGGSGPGVGEAGMEQRDASLFRPPRPLFFSLREAGMCYRTPR